MGIRACKHFTTRICKALGFLLCVLLFGIASHAQGMFRLESSIGPQPVWVNGVAYSIDSVGSKIKTHYPGFDTLRFIGKGQDEATSILCNFKPDSAYSLSVACCGTLDIVPSSCLGLDSLRYWDIEEDFDKIQAQLMDRPYISIRTRSKPTQPIYAWHADAACETAHQRLGTRPWRMGVPPKCFYWSNVTTILFFKTDDKLPPHEETDLEEFLDIPNIVTLGDITFRLFDDQRFVLFYDEQRNHIRLEYD